MRAGGNGSKKFLIIVLLILIAVVFVVRHREMNRSIVFRFLDSLMVTVTSPVQKLYHATSGGFHSVIDHYFFLVGAAKENEQLQAEMVALKGREVLNANLEVENRRLRDLLDLKKSLSGEWVAADVISFPPISPYRLITINKGASAGIRRTAAVIAPEGLVGQVVRVFDSSSQVLLVTDPTSAVDGRIGNTGSRGLVVGKTMKMGFEHELFLGSFEYLNQAAAIEEGAGVVTSGLDGIYPPDILIGHARIGKHSKKYDIFQEADVIPAVDYYQLREVLVLK